MYIRPDEIHPFGRVLFFRLVTILEFYCCLFALNIRLPNVKDVCVFPYDQASERNESLLSIPSERRSYQIFFRKFDTRQSCINSI